MSTLHHHVITCQARLCGCVCVCVCVFKVEWGGISCMNIGNAYINTSTIFAWCILSISSFSICFNQHRYECVNLLSLCFGLTQSSTCQELFILVLISTSMSGAQLDKCCLGARESCCAFDQQKPRLKSMAQCFPAIQRGHYILVHQLRGLEWSLSISV